MGKVELQDDLRSINQQYNILELEDKSSNSAGNIKCTNIGKNSLVSSNVHTVENTVENTL